MTNKMKKKIIALVLTTLLVFSSLPVLADGYCVDGENVGQATNSLTVSGDNNGINYLSLGDSIAFGYGLDGDATHPATSRYLNDYCVEGSYPYLIKEYLKCKEDNFFQGAVCGAKVIDLCKLLSPDDYPNDSGFKSFIDSYLKDEKGETYNNYGKYMLGLKEAVENADFITITAGGNDSMAVLTSLFSGSTSSSTETLSNLSKLYGKAPYAVYISMKNLLLAQAKLIDSVKNNGGATEKSLESIFGLLESILYSMSGFAIGENDVLDIIHKINPDAVIAVTGMPALFKEFIFKIGEGSDAIEVDLEKVFSPMVHVLNNVIKNAAEERSAYVRYVDIFDMNTMVNLSISDTEKSIDLSWAGVDKTKNIKYLYKWDADKKKYIIEDANGAKLDYTKFAESIQTSNILMFIADQFLNATHPSLKGHEYIANQIMYNFDFDNTSNGKENAIKNYLSGMWTTIMSKLGIKKAANLLTTVIQIDMAGLIQNFSGFFNLIKNITGA